MAIEVKQRVRTYKDISLAFSPHPLTGDLPVLKDDRAINASLKNCIMIVVGEKPFLHDFGSQVMDIMFDMVDDISARDLERENQTFYRIQ